jgi:TolB-like protein
LARQEAEAAAKAAIANERSLNAAELPAKSVGVAPLAVVAADSALAPLGYGLADLLITDLSRSAQLQVVDRLRVSALLSELQLARSGAVDTTSAPRVGKLVGARKIVSGAIGRLSGQGVTVSARISDVGQGALVGQPINTHTAIRDILDAEKMLAFRIFDELGVTLTPKERAAVEQRPTRYLAAFLAYGRGVRAEAIGELGRARAEYQNAVFIDPGFRLASLRLSQVPAGSGPASAVRTSSLPSGALAGLVNALNPSPAAILGTVRDRGDLNGRAALQAQALGTIIIEITIP